MKKRNLIIIIAVTASALILALATWLAVNNKKQVETNNLYEKTISSKYGNASDLSSCQGGKGSQACLTDINKQISTGVSLQLSFIGEGADSSVSSELSVAKDAVTNNDWQLATTSLSSAISDSSILINKYISSTKADAKLIHDLLIPNTTSHVSNYFIDEEWAVASLSTSGTDPANVLLQKVNGSWTIIAGPGTSFDPGTASGLGATEEVESHLQTTYHATIVEYPGLTSTADGSTISSTMNELAGNDLASLPLYDQLPIETDNYTIRADYVNNKPYYIVTVYYDNDSDKASNQKEAAGWLSTNGVNTETAPIQYEYLENSNDE